MFFQSNTSIQHENFLNDFEMSIEPKCARVILDGYVGNGFINTVNMYKDLDKETKSEFDDVIKRAMLVMASIIPDLTNKDGDTFLKDYHQKVHDKIKSWNPTVLKTDKFTTPMATGVKGSLFLRQAAFDALEIKRLLALSDVYLTHLNKSITGGELLKQKKDIIVQGKQLLKDGDLEAYKNHIADNKRKLIEERNISIGLTESKGEKFVNKVLDNSFYKTPEKTNVNTNRQQGRKY
jgi:hypothetical protein